MDLKYLWDTNIVIYYLQGQLSVSSENLMQDIIGQVQPALTVINEIELLCWQGASERDMQVLKQFTAGSAVFNLTELVKLKTIVLRREYKIKLPDAIIAATALSYDLTLLTRNVKDFKNIKTLEIFNPFSSILP